MEPSQCVVTKEHGAPRAGALGTLNDFSFWNYTAARFHDFPPDEGMEVGKLDETNRGLSRCRRSKIRRIVVVFWE